MKTAAMITMALLWYLDILGTGHVRTILGGVVLDNAANIQPATLGPYETEARCGQFRDFYESRDVVTLGCRFEEDR